MKKSICTLAVAGSLLAPLAVPALAFASTPTYNTNTANCAVSIVGSTNTVGRADSRFVNNNDGTVTTQVVVKGTPDCTKTVSIASWRAPYGSKTFTPIKDQTLVDSKSATFGVGTHALTVKIADCMYQVDLMYGSETTVNGTPEYPDAQKLGWVQAGTKVCEKAPVAVTPSPAPTPTPVTPAATSTPVSTPAAEVQAPDELPNTGAGNLVGLFFGTTLVAGLLHRLYSRRMAANA